MKADQKPHPHAYITTTTTTTPRPSPRSQLRLHSAPLPIHSCQDAHGTAGGCQGLLRMTAQPPGCWDGRCEPTASSSGFLGDLEEKERNHGSYCWVLELVEKGPGSLTERKLRYPESKGNHNLFLNILTKACSRARCATGIPGTVRTHHPRKPLYRNCWSKNNHSTVNVYRSVLFPTV